MRLDEREDVQRATRGEEEEILGGRIGRVGRGRVREQHRRLQLLLIAGVFLLWRRKDKVAELRGEEEVAPPAGWQLARHERVSFWTAPIRVAIHGAATIRPTEQLRGDGRFQDPLWLARPDRVAPSIGGHRKAAVRALAMRVQRLIRDGNKSAVILQPRVHGSPPALR